MAEYFKTLVCILRVRRSVFPDGILPDAPFLNFASARRKTQTATSPHIKKPSARVKNVSRLAAAKPPKNEIGMPYIAASKSPIETWYILRPARTFAVFASAPRSAPRLMPNPYEEFRIRSAGSRIETTPEKTSTSRSIHPD
ncbi:hypothetical protein BH20ACT10_BH20ACT10_23390 [soil metagenome]